MASDPRKEWRAIKDKLKKSGIDPKTLADKPGFGPALDAVEKRNGEIEKEKDQAKKELIFKKFQKDVSQAVAAAKKYRTAFTQVKAKLDADKGKDQKAQEDAVDDALTFLDKRVPVVMKLLEKDVYASCKSGKDRGG